MYGNANIAFSSAPSAPQGGVCPPPNPFGARFQLPPAPHAACPPAVSGYASVGSLTLSAQILSILLQEQDLTQMPGQGDGGPTLVPLLAAEVAQLLWQRARIAKPDKADKASEEGEGAEEGENDDVKKDRRRKNADEDGDQLSRGMP